MSDASVEYTLVVVKPDGLKKSLTGNILTKLAEARFMIIGAKVLRVSRELAEQHYQHLKGKPFFNDLIDYIQGKPYGPDFERVMALVYKGPNAIKKIREIAGQQLMLRPVTSQHLEKKRPDGPQTRDPLVNS
jgi:nucleoside-diphosphate kinase